MNVVLQQNRVYSHKILRMYYTTYDVRREEDVIHIGTPQCNVILLNGRYARETWDREHPYLYARILGIFHANVTYVGDLPGEEAGSRPTAPFHRIDFLWVQWYEYLGSKDQFSLDRLSLRPVQSATALDFLDPQDILRGVHLIPQFSLGESTAPLPSFRFSALKDQVLWKAYYINR